MGDANFVGRSSSDLQNDIFLGATFATPVVVEGMGTRTASQRKPTAEWPYRIRDLTLVLLALPSILPMIAVIAALIKIDTPSAPVFYLQTRYGKGGRPFRILKFRTMVPGAEKLRSALLEQSVDKGAGFKLDDDPRVTRPGRWLRRLYLDELPQLWNIAMGRMTLVGPRPNSQAPDMTDPWQMERLMVRPGLTGSWQVMKPKPTEFDLRCRIDVEYVRNRSFGRDLRLLFQTLVVCVLGGSGS